MTGSRFRYGGFLPAAATTKAGDSTAELIRLLLDNGLPEAVKPLMRCSEASSYGLYALLDICIHYDGWDLATTTSYLENSYGLRIRNPRARYTWQSLIIRAIT